MESLGRPIRWLLVVALVAGLGISPAAPMLAAGCPMAENDQAGQRHCCCGKNCQCLDCPAVQSGSKSKKEAPIASAPGRDIAKIQSTSAAAPTIVLADVGKAELLAAAMPNLVCVSTLISQHTCLRV
jgi:hypothetical protein